MNLTAGHSTIPRLPGAVVERSRLLRRLDALAPLAIVRGISGTGKTTLAAHWATTRQHMGDKVLWFNAADIGDPASLVGAISSHGCAKIDGPGRTIAIIDDAHFLTDETSLHRLCRLLSTHASTHVLLATQATHPIQGIAQVYRISMRTLTDKDLHATRPELAHFAKAWGHDLSESSARALFDHVNGWLEPTRRALEDVNCSDDPRGLLAAAWYVREQILPKVTNDDSLRVAMALSLADDITENLARAVLSDDLVLQGGLAGTFEHFEAHGVLERIPASDGQHRWRFPVLIAQILTEMYKLRYPDAAVHTHGVLAHVLEGQADQESRGHAIRHARAAGDWGLLARMWRHHGLGLTIHHAADAYDAYRDMPSQVITEYPTLAVAASVTVALRSYDDPERRAAVIRSYADAGWASYAVSSDAPTDTLAVTSEVIALRASGDPFASLEIAERHDQGLTTVPITPIPYATQAWFELQWGLSAFAAEEGVLAIQMFTRAAQSAVAIGADFIVSAASAQLGLINALAGHTRTAAGHLAVQDHIDTSGQWLDHTVTAAGHIATAILKLDRLDPGASCALDLVGDSANSPEEWAVLAWVRTQHALLFGDPATTLVDIAHMAALHEGMIHPEGREQRTIDRCTAELLLAMGEFNRAERSIRDAGETVPTLAVPRARLALICGNYDVARSIAAASAWDATTTLRDRVRLLMIKAAAALATDDEDAATISFHRVCAFATEMNTLIPFTTIPRAVLRRLLKLADNPLSNTDLTIIESCREAYPASGELIRLTPREKTILYATVEHKTFADIAKAHTVSINTVKKQVSSVYTKLGVHDRATALLQAHRLGLLPAPRPGPGNEHVAT